MTVSFAVPKEDLDLITRIVDRAQAFARVNHVSFDRQGATMDITAVHANGCPLRLELLLDAEDFDFTHDVFGIFRHLDRTTGRLGNCFLPRHARP